MSRQNVKNTIIDKLLSFVAPHLCYGCGLEGFVLCEDCKYDIIRLPFTQQLPAGGVAYENVWIVGERRGVLQLVIGALKFRNVRTAGGDLADLLARRIPSLPDATLLVPIPTASPHIRERGYDQALLIARQLGRLRGVPVKNILRRRHIKTQHKANRQERIAQASTAFQVQGPLNPHAHYVLVDDIVTTGSTLEAAAAVLMQAGARSISVAALARQPLD